MRKWRINIDVTFPPLNSLFSTFSQNFKMLPLPLNISEHFRTRKEQTKAMQRSIHMRRVLSIAVIWNWKTKNFQFIHSIECYVSQESHLNFLQRLHYVGWELCMVHKRTAMRKHSISCRLDREFLSDSQLKLFNFSKKRNSEIHFPHGIQLFTLYWMHRIFIEGVKQFVMDDECESIKNWKSNFKLHSFTLFTVKISPSYFFNLFHWALSSSGCTNE